MFIIYDDFHFLVKTDQSKFGTVLPNYGNGALRHGEKLIVVKEERLGNLHGYTGGDRQGMVYDSDKLAPTLNAMQGGGRQPHVVVTI